MEFCRFITICLLVLLAPPLASCSDSRLAPAGLRQARQAALDVPTPGADRARPTPPKPQPPATPKIPTPPYRLDVRVDPADLALLPPAPAVVVAMRPDFPAGLLALGGRTAEAGLMAVPLGELGRILLRRDLVRSFGLTPDRAILISAFGPRAPDGPRLAALSRHLATLVEKKKAARLRAVPAAVIGARLVARVAQPATLRKALTAASTAARARGAKHDHLLSAPTTPAVYKRLAPRGAVRVSYDPAGHAHAWSLAGGRLVVDVVTSVSGTWTPRRAARALSESLAATGAGYQPTAFDRMVLLASADVALVLQPVALAGAARWIGIRELLGALGNVTPDKRAKLLATGWRIAGVPARFSSVPKKAFAGFGLRGYLLRPWPQLRLSWRLNASGRKLFAELTRTVAGKNLATDNGFVERWLKPLAARADVVLPPTGPFRPADLPTRLSEGGLLLYLIAVAELWPRLLNRKPVRKRVLRFLRKRVRPARFVRRVNVGLRAGVLELALEARPPAKAR